jgi:hypothetical protein
MKHKLKTLLREPWVILASWLLLVMFMVVVLPAVSYTTYEMGLTQSIDTNFSFNPEQIYPILESYGVEGRAYYLRQRWTFDLVWPLLYGLPLWLTNHRLMPLLQWQKVYVLNATPLLAILFDYLENSVFSIMVLAYPNPLNFFAFLGVSLNFIKWVMLGFAYLLTFVVLIRFSWHYLQKNFSKKSF